MKTPMCALLLSLLTVSSHAMDPHSGVGNKLVRGDFLQLPDDQYERFLPNQALLNDKLRSAHAGECEGFLTADPAQQFCSDSVPDDWREMDFNGLRVYHVPLQAPHNATATIAPQR